MNHDGFDGKEGWHGVTPRTRTKTPRGTGRKRDGLKNLQAKKSKEGERAVAEHKQRRKGETAS